MTEENKYTIKMESKTVEEHIMKEKHLRKMFHKECNYLVISKVMYTRMVMEAQRSILGQVDLTAPAFNYEKYIEEPNEYMGMKVIVLDDEDETIRIG
ncbi:hypothetical protein BH780_gp219 [Bacillus phage Eldridge]|uniref:Uncharacterized protein n=1 Tax=Bacillus phage Eldridge TaxID=1776293 RepID=A0A0Y0DBR5_9CAUD|nr:hypothetical protein BH780_gp219 [Bacillus phage Eldridge]AMB18802.1 hypothetical protein Eldridge_0222 [Bacillus phage Eldridge]